MKKVFSILFLAIGTKIMNAHPSVTSHLHGSIIDEWAWSIIPILIISAFGFYYTKKKARRLLSD